MDLRIIAATNQDLASQIQEKKFREDLYYRLNTITIEAPPLRERPDDVVLLAEHFARRFSKEFRRGSGTLAPEAKQKLKAYAWPGNVRELRNVIERAVLLGSSADITADDIAPGRSAGPKEERLLALPTKGIRLDEVERDLVMQALERTGGNQTRAGELLGLTRDQVHYRMEKYGLTKPEVAN